jgi:Zn-dependent metalloprotease
MRVSVRLRVLLCLLTVATAAVAAQAPPGPARAGLVAVQATTPADLREWDARINQMVRASQFVVSSVQADPDIGGRTHETLAQYHQGIPVYGGSLSRQTAQGVSVSIIGNVFENISVDSTATLSANQIVTALTGAVGAQPVGDAPRLVIFPTVDGAYRRAYRVTMSDTKTYIVDAASGYVLWTIDEMQTQTEIGTGTGALGDQKKMSTTQVAGGFRAHDQLRPAPIRTFDTRGSAAALNRLLQPPGPSVDGDFSADADNTWADAPVVDAHAHTGWMQDYLFKQVGWTGIDNRRGTITSAVHTGLVNNAFFISPPFGADGRGMFVYGRTTAGTPMTALDIVGHEMMHGVTNAALVQRTGFGLLGALFIDRFGPTTVTFGGSSFSCDSMVVNVADGRQLPLFCNAGRYVLVSNHGGAINEGFSDVFGIAAEFFHQPVGSGPLRAEYRLGEDIGIAGLTRAADAPASIGAISSTSGTMPYPDHASRSFSFLLAIAQGTRSNPVLFLLLPWTLSGDQLVLLPSHDSGGVHLNAPLLSHAFYLAIEGGRNATSGLTVQGVGAANRAQIERAFFRAMTVLMPNVPSLPIAAQATVQAAVDLHGANSVAAVAVRQAMQAVGLMN